MSFIAGYIRPELNLVSMAIIATVLVIYGNEINIKIKKYIRQYHFIVRVFIFILVCSFGYGFITIVASKVLQELLAQLSDMALSLSVIGGFFFLGFLADSKNQV